MPGDSRGYRFNRWIWGALLLTPLVIGCVRYLDIPLALGVQTYLYGDSNWARHTSHLPDLLLPIVVATTVLSVVACVMRRKQGIQDTFTAFLRFMSWTAPVSYLVKSALKHLFGRVNTRVWLQVPGSYGFHWFHGGNGFEGFPSGHMIVIVALIAACWRFYPRQRPCGLLLALLLGAALIATNYHFLSDVVAGFYCALATEACLFRALSRWSRSFFPTRPASPSPYRRELG